MNTKLIATLALSTLLFGGCSMGDRHRDYDTGSTSSTTPPANPQGDANPQGPGSNYPPSGAK